MTKKILVTGADGFIGSHLVEALLRQGHEVRAFVYYHPYSERGWLSEIDDVFSKGLEIFPGDVRDPQRVQTAMAGVSTVFHLAALIGIPYSYHAPASYLQTNVLGTQHVLDAALHHHVDKVLVTSTSEVYGSAHYVPIDEIHPRQAQSPYSASKIAADALAQAYHLSFGLPVVIVRPFNTYGPRQSLRAFIPTVIHQLLCGAQMLKLGDLTPTRDWVYVEDTVRGFLALEAAKGFIGEDVNIATSQEYSMSEVVHIIQTLLGTQADIELDPSRQRPPHSEVFRLCGSNKKIRDASWVGSVSLESGLTQTIEWFKGMADKNSLKNPSSYRL